MKKVLVIPSNGPSLEGLLLEPENPIGTVIFAHGSGSSHRSPRNIQVAQALAQNGIRALLFDLLTEEEAEDKRKVFNIPLLASRLYEATNWLKKVIPNGAQEPIGYFGASTGAGAAIWAATKTGNEITAIVSRGGRPDLAEIRLDTFQIPTLLIVGGDDPDILELTRPLLPRMPRSELLIIPGATHLFEESGALEAVSNHAIQWFRRHFEEEKQSRAA